MTREQLRLLIAGDDKAVAQALVFLYQRQTADERAHRDTKHKNYRGFSSAHARLGCYYAQHILKGHVLKGEHMRRARLIALNYVNQLLEDFSFQEVSEVYKINNLDSG